MKDDLIKELSEGKISLEEFAKALGMADAKSITDQVKTDVAAMLTEQMKEIKATKIPSGSDSEATAYKSVVDFAKDVKEVAVKKTQTKQLGEWMEKAAGTGMETIDPEYGGVLVPPEFISQLLQYPVPDAAAIFARVVNIPMARQTVDIPVELGYDQSGGLVAGGITWYWGDELGTLQSTRPKFGKISLKLKKTGAMLYASPEVLEDSAISLQPFFTRKFAESLQMNLAQAFMYGNGIDKPQGILNAPCKIAATTSTSHGDVFLYDDAINMFKRAMNPGSCIWMANIGLLPYLAKMNLVVGLAGAPVFMFNATQGFPATLFGLPLIWTDYCKAPATEGDIVLVDWGQYMVGRKTGDAVRFDLSIHLKFDVDQIAFRWITRIDGQCWLPSALTPLYGETRSPVITLAAR
jgi:HK97 family phage major capsid protein